MPTGVAPDESLMLCLDQEACRMAGGGMMVELPLEGIRVAILVADNFEESELTEPKDALERAGAIALICSTETGGVHAMRHDMKAETYPVDRELSEADPDHFHAVMLPGGALNADKLRMVPEAQQFVRRIEDSGKPIAAICHAPWLLVSAGLVNGRRLTSYYTIQDDIRNAGGEWVDAEVCQDGNWITSRSPRDLPAFNRAMIELFAGRAAQGHVAA